MLQSTNFGRATSQRSDGCYLRSISFTVLNSVAVTRSCPQRKLLLSLMIESCSPVHTEEGVNWAEAGIHRMNDSNLLKSCQLCHLTAPSQHKTIVHTGAYSGSAVVERSISLLCNKCSELALEKQRLWDWRIDTLRRWWPSCFNSGGEGMWPEKKMGESSKFSNKRQLEFTKTSSRISSGYLIL